MSRLSRVTRILHVQIKSQCKNDCIFVTWSRGLSTKANHSEGPVKVLQEKIETGELKHDEHQTKVMTELQQLYDSIQTYTPVEVSSKSSLLKWLPIKSANNKNAPKGLYIHGSVGGGKTTLMDLFYNSCTSVSISGVAAMEFHSFQQKDSRQPKLAGVFFICRYRKRNESISTHL